MPLRMCSTPSTVYANAISRALRRSSAPPYRCTLGCALVSVYVRLWPSSQSMRTSAAEDLSPTPATESLALLGLPALAHAPPHRLEARRRAGLAAHEPHHARALVARQHLPGAELDLVERGGERRAERVDDGVARAPLEDALAALHVGV